MKNVLILGSSGSIGQSTLDVVGRHPDLYRVWAITANRNARSVIEQIRQYRPSYVVMADPAEAAAVVDFVREHAMATEVLSGAAALVELAVHSDVDIVMAAIVGAAGLLPTIAAAGAGKRLLLANKESIVCAGRLFMNAVAQGNALLMPVDSEHNAIFQCLPAPGSPNAKGQIEKILLTGSGGPFRGWNPEQLESVTPDQACAHPNWSMGRKISVDSATMMNKGLEFIEASWLFDLPPNKIEILLHPQSIVHSMVEYQDGSVLAQMGNPDMRTAIAHALSWPERVHSGVASLDFSSLNLSFEKPDFTSYPCLQLAMTCADQMGASPAVLNAANEIAVAAFLNGEIGFLDISSICSDTLESLNLREPVSIDEVLSIDAEARATARQLITKYPINSRLTIAL